MDGDHAMDMGPFGIMDSVGLDTVLKINEIWAQQLNDPKAMANMEFLKKYTDAGKLGKKRGKVFTPTRTRLLSPKTLYPRHL